MGAKQGKGARGRSREKEQRMEQGKITKRRGSEKKIKGTEQRKRTKEQVKGRQKSKEQGKEHVE